MDLMRLPIGKVYKSIMDAPGSFVALGFTHPAHGQLLLSCSVGQIGALAADESFCERVFSAANLVRTEGKTCLSFTTIEMLVISASTARSWSSCARTTQYPQLSRQQ
jgi:hypothetical protein